MKYIREGLREDKININDLRKIRHNLDLYYMYDEYNKECEKILIKIKELNVKLDENENDLMEYTDHKNRLISENEFSRLDLDLNKDLEEGYKNREEFSEIIKKFNAIDTTNDMILKEKLISELDTKESYRKYKNDIMKANEYNEAFIENILNKKKEIEENFSVVEEDNIKVNSEVIKEFNSKISSINSKIERNKESIAKNNKDLSGLIEELNRFLRLGGYEDVNVYRQYLHNLKFIIKKY